MMEWPEIDFKHLKDVNPKTVGWIHLDGTPIDYPVVRTQDDFYYLSHNFSDEESPHGCIFTKNEGDFPGKRCNIYGHNMRDSSMFGWLLCYYYEEGFYENHKTIDLKTEEANYKIKVFGSIQYPVDCAFMQKIPLSEDYFKAWKKAIKKLSPFTPDFDLDMGDPIAALCTCRQILSNKYPGELIVVGKIERMD